MSLSVLLAFFSYLAILLGIGLWAHQAHRSSTDFILGNRSLNFWLTALSAHASDMSAWLFMGLPGLVFLTGVPNIWIAIGLTVCMYLNWQYVAKRLRIETERAQSYTLSSYFENRFKDSSGILRICTAIMAVGFMMHYLAAGMIAMGFLFESLFGLNYYFGLSVAMVVAISYTLAGGYITIAWTDSFQAIFLVVVIVFVPVVALYHMDGGIPEIISAAQNQGIPLSIFPKGDVHSILSSIVLAVSWGLGYFGLPHVLTKFMGIRKASDLNKSKILGISWQIIALTAAVLVGLVGIGFFSGQKIEPELVFVEMVKSLFHPFPAAFILCAIIAANMSTMDSQILVCASIISEDFYKRFLRTKATQERLLLVSRIGVVAVSLVALAIAFSRNSTVYEAVKYAWTGLGCSFGPLVIMSLFTKSANKFGAVAGIIVGGLIAALWPLFFQDEIPAMIPGFTLSLLSIYVVSKLTNGSNANA